jgi:hypothetical protein
MLQKKKATLSDREIQRRKNRRRAVGGQNPDQLRLGVLLVVLVFIGAIRGLEWSILSYVAGKGNM